MKVGYARVSSRGQSLEVQLDALKAHGCEKVFKEKQSGKTADDRRELQRALEFVRESDVLVVTKLDRLARSTPDLHIIAQALHTKGAGFIVLDQPDMNTTTKTGKLLFSILGAIAEFERDLINERAAEGRIKAMEQGVRFGRKPTLTERQVKALDVEARQGKLSKEALADKYGVSRATVYRVLAG